MMKAMKFRVYTISVSLAAGILTIPACVDPYRPVIDVKDTQPILVVQGTVTDAMGPFSVKLTQSVDIFNNLSVNESEPPVTGADVHIIDDKGHDYHLLESTGGWYRTAEEDLKGDTGNTYILTIATADGKEYESSPQLLTAVPDIDSVYFEETEITHFEGDKPVTETWLNILADSKPADQEMYFRWDCDETWEFHMPTRILVDHGPPNPNVFSYEPPSWETITIDAANEQKCWITEPTRKILVTSTTGYPDRTVKHFLLQSIGPPGDKLNIRYSILVRQYAIDKEVYGILRRLRDANVETAGLYSTNPGQVFGNISCCSSGEKALGYFMASGMKTRRIFILPEDHHVTPGNAFDGCGWSTDPADYVRLYLYGTYDGRKVWSDNRYCVDCTVRGTRIKPDFW